MRQRKTNKRISSVTFREMFPLRTDGLCACGCGLKLSGRATRWATPTCSRAAAERYKIAKGYSKALRRAVYERDGGICAKCGLDTESARRELIWRPRVWCKFKRKWIPNPQTADEVERERKGQEFERRGFPCPSRSWWQADHVLELADGGTHALDNLQTLCIECHKAKSAANVRARARAKRPEFTLSLFDDSPVPENSPELDRRDGYRPQSATHEQRQPSLHTGANCD